VWSGYLVRAARLSSLDSRTNRVVVAGRLGWPPSCHRSGDTGGRPSQSKAAFVKLTASCICCHTPLACNARSIHSQFNSLCLIGNIATAFPTGAHKRLDDIILASPSAPSPLLPSLTPHPPPLPLQHHQNGPPKAQARSVDENKDKFLFSLLFLSDKDFYFKMNIFTL
jgi:hypothetical protein